jgi:uncharacterized protein (TIGR03000 family)
MIGYGCTGGTPAPTPEPTPEPDSNKGDKGDKGVRGPSPARLLVQLPADARLSIDGQATTSTSASRTFTTPPLQPGRTYHYDLTAVTYRNGDAVRTTQRVNVRAGHDTRVVITFPASGTGQALARR